MPLFCGISSSLLCLRSSSFFSVFVAILLTSVSTATTTDVVSIHPITGDVYQGLDCNFESFPADDECDPKAYVGAIDSMQKGDCVTIFTPDDTHFEIAMACVQKGTIDKNIL